MIVTALLCPKLSFGCLFNSITLEIFTKFWHNKQLFMLAQLCILAEQLGPASTIHFSIILPYLKVMVIFCHMWLHQCDNRLEKDFIGTRMTRIETRTSGFKPNPSTTQPSHLFNQFLMV